MYLANDGQLDSNVATVNLNVALVPPTTNDFSFWLHNNWTHTFNLASDTTTLPGTTLSFRIVSAPKHGDLILNADGTYTYKPNDCYVGADSFSFIANNGQADSNVATATIDVRARNRRPDAEGETVYVAENESQQINLMQDASDPDGDPLTLRIVHGPRHGTLSLNPDSTYTYTPTVGWTGEDSFAFVANDTQYDSNTAVIHLDVDPRPVAQDESVSVRTGKSVGIALVPDDDDDSGDDELYAKILSQPQHGKMEQDDDGQWFYTANAGFIGTDTFTYALSTGELDSKPATVTITVLPPKRPPVANDATISVPSERPSPINILANASDPDGQALTVHIVDGPSHGCLQRNDDGSYNYVPQDEWYGDNSFSYYVNDSEAKSNIATVHIKVVPMPTAENAQFRVDSDGTVLIDLRRLVDDPDENAEANLAISVNAPSHGQLIRQKDGSYLYKSESGFSGTDAFTYTVGDGAHNASAMITLDVRRGDDDDHCMSSQTLLVQSGRQIFDVPSGNYGYILVNRGTNHPMTQIDTVQEDALPDLNWNAPPQSISYDVGQSGGSWWSDPFDSPLLDSDHQAKKSGLIIKKMH
jgi:VCBS repeat-containing protein